MEHFWRGLFFSIYIIYKSGFKKRSEKINSTIAIKYLLLVITVGLMLASTNYTLSHMPVGYALALFQLSILLTVILGHRLFNEAAS